MVLKLTILTIFFIGLKAGIALSMDGQVSYNKNELANPKVAASFIEERGINQNLVRDSNFRIGFTKVNLRNLLFDFSTIYSSRKFSFRRRLEAVFL